MATTTAAKAAAVVVNYNNDNNRNSKHTKIRFITKLHYKCKFFITIIIFHHIRICSTITAQHLCTLSLNETHSFKTLLLRVARRLWISVKSWPMTILFYLSSCFQFLNNPSQSATVTTTERFHVSGPRTKIENLKFGTNDWTVIGYEYIIYIVQRLKQTIQKNGAKNENNSD